MKLNCVVEVSNRLLPSANIPARRKPQRSCLAIGRQSVKNNELHLLLQSQQNKHGTVYKIDKNIDKVFTKFIDDGKATIRLIEPPHDLIIQCDAVQLKGFMRVLKLGLSKKVDPSVLNVSGLNRKYNPISVKTKVTVKSNAEYPTLVGFPRTTEELRISGLGRKSFDRHILRLQKLRVLNLSNNHISSLPKELGSLPHLQELILSENNLGNSMLYKWAWLNQTEIQNNLRFLDLSANLLCDLPEQIGKLNALVNLKISQNVLSCLPQSMGNLSHLMYLDVSKNSLCYLPGSMRYLQLDMIDISGNPFPNIQLYTNSKLHVPSLVECASKIFLKTRRMYDSSLLPSTLVTYLDAAKYCACNSPCFNSYIKKLKYCDLNQIAVNVISSAITSVPFEYYLCSTRCFQRI